MGRTLRRAAAASLVAALVGTLVFAQVTAASALTDRRRAARAIGYLATKQRANGSIPAFSTIGSTADAVLAVVAAGTGRDVMRAALSFLRDRVQAGKVTTLGLRAKVAIAVAAAGRDPHDFGHRDLIRRIRSTMGADGHFGNGSVLDQTLAILAIEAAGNTPRSVALGWLESAQCPDGGWAFDAPYDPSGDDADCRSISDPANDFFPADSNTTSYAVQAIEAFDGAFAFPANPFAFFRSLRDAVHGGWSYTSDSPGTDANSTALVLSAYVSAGRRLPVGGLEAMRALQYTRCGAFAYSWSGNALTAPDVGATIGGVLGLRKRAIPFTGTVIGSAPSVADC
jgi:hypothetical protein